MGGASRGPCPPGAGAALRPSPSSLPHAGAPRPRFLRAIPVPGRAVPTSPPPPSVETFPCPQPRVTSPGGNSPRGRGRGAPITRPSVQDQAGPAAAPVSLRRRAPRRDCRLPVGPGGRGSRGLSGSVGPSVPGLPAQVCRREDSAPAPSGASPRQYGTPPPPVHRAGPASVGWGTAAGLRGGPLLAGTGAIRLRDFEPLAST